MEVIFREAIFRKERKRLHDTAETGNIWTNTIY